MAKHDYPPCAVCKTSLESGPWRNVLDSPAGAKDASTPQLAHNVTFFLGVSFFFPTTFEYTTPR